jgi:tetratricopeptide (TPR) repeat protein
MSKLRVYPLVMLLSGMFFLAACESDTQKAERHFQSGLALLASGDEERALVEFRNVFKYDGFHKQARQIYADTVLERGGVQEAYSQYLRLIEQYPDTSEVREELAEIAISRGDWDEATRHGKAALALAPDVPDVQAIGLALAYRDASLARDTGALATLSGEAAVLLDSIRAQSDGDNRLLVRIVIEDRIRSEDFEAALSSLDGALIYDPDAEDLNSLKARLLAQTGDTAAAGVQLEKMVELFPENVAFRQALINWYLVQDDLDGAETFLRALAGPETGPTERHVTVVQLLASRRGADAARAEIERLIAANAGTENGRLYRAMLAGMTFESGAAEAGIADLRAALEGAEPGNQTHKLQIMLAQMLESTQAPAAARTLVQTVLEQDPSNVSALQMEAGWLIDEDRSGDAIVALRSALNQDPRNAETLTLMARAHERDGDTELMGERLALAVEVSQSGVGESIRYARFLVGQDRLPVALTVLEDARRRAPGTTDLLRLLADLQLQSRDWSRAQITVQQLRDLGTTESAQIAVELQARILQGQGRTDDSLALLNGQIGEDIERGDSQAARATTLILQAQISSGKVEAARVTLDAALANAPDNAQLQLLDASLHAVAGDTQAAIAGFRSLVEQHPQSLLPLRLLMSVLIADNRPEEAAKVLDDALERAPQQANLLWVKAGLMEQDGDIEGAIAVYEQLYAEDSGNAVIANNLASMISTYRDNAEDLQRAATISRRLRGTTVPAFQDTYGWIAYRRGELEEAVRYLEPAAAALPRDPLVQYHLGMTYAAQDLPDAARTALTRALEIAGDSPLPQFETARETLAGLDADTAPLRD